MGKLPVSKIDDESPWIDDLTVDEAMAKLSEKDARFVRAYINDPVPSRAAVAIGVAPGEASWTYSSKTMRKRNVQNAIRAIRKELIEKTKIDAEWILKRLVSMATTDVSEMFYANGTIRPVEEMTENARKLIVGIEVKELWEGYGGKRRRIGENIKLTLADPLKILDMIGRHININAFRPDVNIQTPVLVVRDYTGKDVIDGDSEEGDEDQPKLAAGENG